MHELTVANEIIELTWQIAREHDLKKVSAVKVRIGALASIDPEALVFSFEIGVKGTSLDGCQLIIDQVPIRAKCTKCANEFELEELPWSCPKCHSADVRLIQGDELEIDHVVGG